MDVPNLIAGVAELERWKQKGLETLAPPKCKVTVGMATCGLASGAKAVFDALTEELSRISEDVVIAKTGCLGFCQMEPIVEVFRPGQDRVLYKQVTADNVAELVAAIVTGKPWMEHVLCTLNGRKGKPKGGAVTGIPRMEDIPFYKKQKKIALSRCGCIDPENLAEYIATGGYFTLCKVLASMTPDAVVAEVEGSGLRGRGGAGFSTGRKWQLARNAPGDRKFIVCNADEGDPGAYMDRSLLEGDPFAVLEGMTIGAYAIGAHEGFFYVRDEYPLAVENLNTAIAEARAHGLIGENILGTGFSFDVRLIRGGGAFVCGEETALIASIEGRPGEPQQRPPYPAEKGLWGKPTNINNVETWANVPWILEHGADAFRGVGTETSKGTKVFSIVGKINNTGLIEVPMGLTLREIVHDIGGGIPGGKKFKSVQTGGPSGGCIPEQLLDLPVDYESLTQAGAIMGSGGMIVMDEDTCMVDVARYFLDFLKEESCGKCAPCREGIDRALEVLQRICRGDGREGDIESLEAIGRTMKGFSLCALGKTAPNSVLSTIRYFREEYEAHIRDRRCPAGVCKELTGAPCQSACPLGTETWRYIAHLQRMEFEEAYKVIREANPFPSVCARVCSHPCEMRCRASSSGGEAIAIRSLKRFVTDRVDPSVYKPARAAPAGDHLGKVAVVGSGPAGLAAAHYLALSGHEVTIFEREREPGGMLVSCIPAYRLPREVVRKEIEALMDDHVTLKCNAPLGRDITVEGLFEDGFKAVFLAMGAHRSRRVNMANEEVEGVYPAMDFLKAFNLRATALARGHVGVIGGGNSAIDAARTALRQKGVESVTVFYRRTRAEMPAFKEEIDAALEEGVQLEPLMSPIRIHAKNGRLVSVECISNKLGEVDSSGRPAPVSIPGTERNFALDTLIVAIGEEPETETLSSSGIHVDKGLRVVAERQTCRSTRPGVFAGGDVVTGPNTVIEAIAAGKTAALMIARYLCGEELVRPTAVQLPQTYIEPPRGAGEESFDLPRVSSPRLTVKTRKHNFTEVEMSLSLEEATREAHRCLRCDLEFTQARPAGSA